MENCNLSIERTNNKKLHEIIFYYFKLVIELSLFLFSSSVRFTIVFHSLVHHSFFYTTENSVVCIYSVKVLSSKIKKLAKHHSEKLATLFYYEYKYWGKRTRTIAERLTDLMDSFASHSTFTRDIIKRLTDWEVLSENVKND